MTETTKAEPRTTDAAIPMTKQVQFIPLTDLRESPTNPRKTFANMERLIASVKAAGGVLVPLIVRPMPDGQAFEIVAGHRRFRAAKAARMAMLPCDVRDLTDSAVLEIQITENLQREDLSELEEAETFEAMQTAHGYTPEQIAKKIGVSIGTVYARLKLLALCKEARQAVADGLLPSSVAVPLARLSTHTLQAKALDEMKRRFAAEGADGAQVIHARNAIEWIQRDFCRALRSASFDVKDDMLIEGAGACAKCPKNSRTLTPGLFDDLDRSGKGQAFCTDVVCFDAKTTAAWEITATLHRSAGTQVLSADEGAKLFAHSDHLSHDSKFIELDTPNHADKSRRTWREFFDKLPDDKRPALIVAPDRNFKARELVNAQAMIDAVATAPGAPKWAKADQERKAEVAAARAENREARAEQTLRERVTKAAVLKVADKAAAGLPAELLLFVLTGLADRWVPQPVLDALEVADRDAYEKLLSKANERDLRRVLVVFGAFAGDLLDCTDGYPEALKGLAKSAGVDVKAIEKALIAGDEAEALMTKKATKPAKKEGAK